LRLISEENELIKMSVIELNLRSMTSKLLMSENNVGSNTDKLLLLKLRCFTENKSEKALSAI
jgi:hypothetical protein